MRHVPTHAAGVKLQRVVNKIRRFLTNRATPPPTTDRSGRCVTASLSARSPMGFEPSGAPTSMPTSARVIETARRGAISPLEAIRFTVAGKPLPVPPS
jgi:hypothetical protein